MGKKHKPKSLKPEPEIKPITKRTGLTRTKKIEYGIIIGMVVASFFISYGIRAQPLKYGMEIDEFDPYFNFRASTYMHENGLEAYMNWHDELSWYPTGRDVFATSQVMLHLTAVTLYQPFADSMSLKDFVIYFPAIIGSFTVIPIFLLVRRLTNIRIAALSTIFFAVSVPFIQRGMVGWFKSEPLGLFYGIFGIYFFVSGIMNIFEGRQKVGVIKLVGAGLVLACGLSAWGGVVFFFLPMLAWLMFLPGMKGKLQSGLGINLGEIKDNINYNFKTLVIGLGGFAGGLIIISTIFGRSGAIVGNYVAFSLFIVIGFIIFEHIMNKRFKWRYIKSLVLFIGVIVTLGYVTTSYEIGTALGMTWNGSVCGFGEGTPADGVDLKCSIVTLPFERYMKVLLPINDGSGSVLGNSVAEHQVPEFSHIFSRTVFLFIFTPIGFVAIARKAIPVLPASFAVIMSTMAMYVGMSYVRLELFVSLGMIIMGSLGIYYLLQKFAETNDDGRKSERQLRNRKIRGYTIMVFLLATMMIPTAINWSIMMDRPAIILYGASVSPEPHNDWLDTLEWIRVNTPEDSKIMAWWDYGYWIQTQSNRTTFMDNGAYITERIVENGNILTDTPERAVERLQETEADYVVFFVVGQKIDNYIRLALGGDVAKMYWILSIGERDPSEFYDGGQILTNHFYYDTLYGAMIPFVHRAEYLEPQDTQSFDKFAPWTTEGIEEEQKLINPNTGQYYEYGWMKFELKDTAGMKLVYASEGITNPPDEGIFHGVFVYEVPKKVE